MAVKRWQADAKPKKAKFTAKQQRFMVGGTEKVDYQVLVESTAAAIRSAPSTVQQVA